MRVIRRDPEIMDGLPHRRPEEIEPKALATHGVDSRDHGPETKKGSEMRNREPDGLGKHQQGGRRDGTQTA